MSEWITDRRPTEADTTAPHYCVYDQRGYIVHHLLILDGEPWKPIPKCEPYVKPKRWRAEYSIIHACWSLIDSPHVTYLCQLNQNTDAHRKAAEKIAAIYEEAMP